MSEDELMNGYLKENNIEMATQSTTSVLSVLNYAPTEKIKLKDKVKVGIAFLLKSQVTNIVSIRCPQLKTTPASPVLSK